MGDPYCFKFSFPLSVLQVGPSCAGKTTALERILATEGLWEEAPEEIFYFYGVASDNSGRIAKKYPKAVVREGLPDLGDPEKVFGANTRRKLVIFDDLSLQLSANPQFTDLLIKYVHHLNMCLFQVSHFLYYPNPQSRIQSQNFTVFLIHRAPKALNQLNHFSRSISIGAPKLLTGAYASEIKKSPYSFLTIDMRANTPGELRLIGNLFADQAGVPYQTCYGLL